jgi:heme-degrading monooxygenase HmoA
VAALAVLAFALLLAGCSGQKTRAETTSSSKTEMVSPTTQVLANNLHNGDLRSGGIAMITPSSTTGQEEDKQALALAFTGVLREILPDLRVVSLPETLSSINRAGLTSEYKRMFEDYRLTGIFERDTLQKVARVTGSRYVAQLKLGAFRQEAKGRWGFLGIRVMETKSSTIRLFLQIWDSNDGSIAWEGSQESTLAHESVSEEYVTMRSVVEASARDLVAHFP